MNKKEKYNDITFIYTEEFKTTSPVTKEELKRIFNIKYYNYIKKKENKIFGGCNNY